MSSSSIWPIDRTLSGATTPSQSGLGNNGKKRASPHSPKPQRYWSLTIKLFNVPSRTVIWGVLSFRRNEVSEFYNPRRLGFTSMSKLQTGFFSPVKVISLWKGKSCTLLKSWPDVISSQWRKSLANTHIHALTRIPTQGIRNVLRKNLDE